MELLCDFLRGNRATCWCGNVWNVKESKDGLEYSINYEHPLISEYIKDVPKENLENINKLLKLLVSTVPKIMTDIKTDVVSNYSDKDI